MPTRLLAASASETGFSWSVACCGLCRDGCGTAGFYFSTFGERLRVTCTEDLASVMVLTGFKGESFLLFSYHVRWPRGESEEGGWHACFNGVAQGEIGVVCSGVILAVFYKLDRSHWPRYLTWHGWWLGICVSVNGLVGLLLLMWLWIIVVKLLSVLSFMFFGRLADRP